MKRIVATRMYDFDYFHRFFFQYYINLNFDSILIFAKKKHHEIIKKSINSPSIELVELKDYSEPLLFHEEIEICNEIYMKSLDYYEENYSKQEAYILFADDDEFYPKLNTKSIITRTVFFEWYLPKYDNITASCFYDRVKSNLCKGKLLLLWNDPFYKESIIIVNKKTIGFLRSCKYSNAFHRLTFNNKIINIQKEYVIVNHLKGIPFFLAKDRILKKIKKIKNEDDWCSNHYIFEYKQIFKEYDKFYKSLNDMNELIEIKDNKINNFLQEVSFFNNTILPNNILTPKLNTPSRFFKIEKK